MTDPRLSSRVRSLGQSATVAINDRSNELRKRGKEVIKLGLGQSPFPVPSRVVDALRKHAGEKDYLPVSGLLSLREEVARHTQRTTGVERSASDVVVAPGSKELIFLAQVVFDGEVLIPNPSWVSYEPQARIIGRSITRLETRRENDWMITAEELDRACQTGMAQAHLLILNYPSNPTGATFDRAALGALAETARAHGVIIVSDEIYGLVHHEGEHVSIASLYPEGTIISGGLSKWCGAGGWRLGTFVFPPELAWMRDAVAAVASETYTSVSAPIQHAAIAAFEGGEDIEDYLDRSRRILGALGSWCHGRLAEAKVHTPKPTGGFYLFADFGAHQEALWERGIRDSRALAEQVLQETHVAFLPGAAFGRPKVELHARLAYVDFDGAAALAAAGNSTQLDEGFLRVHCAPVVEGIERLCQWLET